MGAWGTKAYQTDDAAEWFGSMDKATGLRAHVVETLRRGHLKEGAGGIRAACHVLIKLGHDVIWPGNQLQEDLLQGARALENLVNDLEGGRTSGRFRHLTIASLRSDMETLRKRARKLRKRAK